MNEQHANDTGTFGGLQNRPLPRRVLTLAIVGVLAMAASGGALAQDAQTDTTKNADDAKTLDRVIVTANKREENVREVASSITVLDEKQLERINATQLTDYANYIPGFQVNSNGTPGKTTVSMRGIAPLSSGSTIGTYVDETPVGSSGIYQAATLFALDLLPYDISRIEVLRGPQGTLYGAGAMGGLVKYVTRQPDLQDYEFRVGGGLSGVADGDLGANFRFGANLPLSRDKLGLRVSYARNNIPGYIDNSISGENDINDGSQTSARVAMLWQGDGISLKLAAMRQTIDSDNDASVSLKTTSLDPLGDDLAHQVFVNEPFSKDIDFYSATVDWDLGWADFTSATGYSDTTTRQRGDTTIPYGRFADLALGQPAPGSSYFDVGLDLTKFNQEFRLASKSDQPFEWLLGAFYTREKGNQTQQIFLNKLDGSPLDAPFDALFGSLASLELPSTYKETAVFANGSFKFSDRFKVGAGVRYAQNDQVFSQNNLGGALIGVGQSPGSGSENVFTWSLTPQFQINDNSMVYGKVATGYQPGGPNVAFPGLPSQVDSSTLTSYEVGLKSAFADNSVLLDLAAYRIDWEDIQVPTVFDGKSGLVNGGTATTQGVELATLFSPTANLQLGFNAAYTDAKLTENYDTVVIPGAAAITEITSGLEGNRLPYVPEFSASLTADYFFPFGDWEGNVGGGLRWTGDRVSGTASRTVRRTNATPSTVLSDVTTQPSQLDSFSALDLYAAVSNDHVTIRAYVKNATNERAYLSIANDLNQVTGATNSRSATPVLPRTIGLEVDYRF
ncbi:MAG: TonB-dependent receptor [Thermomonas sp.]